MYVYIVKEERLLQFMKKTDKSHKEDKYDVFLSYRRDGGMETAMLLKDALSRRGYRVFLDVESLRSGPFNKKLYEVIDNCTDFLLVLPQNGLDRCSDEQDWVRLEIERAKSGEKNIIPIMLKGFSWPDELPASIDFLRYQYAPTAVTEYFDAFIDKLMLSLQSEPVRPDDSNIVKKIVSVVVILAIIVLAGFVVKQIMDKKEATPGYTEQADSSEVVQDSAGKSTAETEERENVDSEGSQEKPINETDNKETLVATEHLVPTQVSDENEKADLRPGQLVTYGTYEQDGKKNNGKEIIQWVVLETREDCVLIISRKALDCQPYNMKWADMTWEECSLRTWLNEEFLNEAFSNEEQKAILITAVDNSMDQGNSSWNKKGGYDTEDRVFLLSCEETKSYFDTEEARRCTPTDYAKQKGIWTDGDQNCHWWLRSPGQTQNYAAYISASGTLSSTQDNNSNIGVRPALWVHVAAFS